MNSLSYINPNKEDIENAKVMLGSLFYHPLPKLAYDYNHASYIDKLIPFVASPWCLGAKLFVKSQWLDNLSLDEIEMRDIDIKITRNMIKACKIHCEITKSIYEILKEIYAIKNIQYFNSIPTWLGLILNDFVAYRVHSLCTDECLQQLDFKIANNNIKKHLILKEERFIKSLETKLIFHQDEHFKDKKYITYEATNTLIELCNEIEDKLPNFKVNYYDKFINCYKKYIKYLDSKLWHVAVIDDSGKLYTHKGKGRIPNHVTQKYNKILWMG